MGCVDAFRDHLRHRLHALQLPRPASAFTSISATIAAALLLAARRFRAVRDAAVVPTGFADPTLAPKYLAVTVDFTAVSAARDDSFSRPQHP